mmetsp:Transcript_5961/g.14185  ORF Transcript_5961/g.14185 Transcript_5961/m.14185 type:complete len:361 (-) Transcript_5961:4-1086(-)
MEHQSLELRVPCLGDTVTQHALHEGSHRLHVHILNVGIRESRLGQRQQQTKLLVVLGSHLSTLCKDVLVRLHAVGEVPHHGLPHPRRLGELVGGLAQDHHPPDGKPLLVCNVELLHGLGHGREPRLTSQIAAGVERGQLLVARQELLLRTTGQDHHQGLEMICVHEVPLGHILGGEHIDQVLLSQRAALLLRDHGVLVLEIRQLLGPGLDVLIQPLHRSQQPVAVLGHAGAPRVHLVLPSEPVQVLLDGEGSECISGTRNHDPQVHLLLLLRRHLGHLSLQAPQDTLHVGVDLGQLIHVLDKRIERSKLQLVGYLKLRAAPVPIQATSHAVDDVPVASDDPSHDAKTDRVRVGEAGTMTA